MQAEGFTTSAALTIAALVIHGRFAWYGAGMLVVFTLETIPMLHAWWTMAGAVAIQEKPASENHLTVIGGLIAITIPSHITRSRKAG
ncbi:hypothetical protein [Pseudogemmobacter bohemicus]|uniref:hypothetical protein n=1 Tax=Pseudogemmobacter bohemicus TaxID=2250708 RepID=UPI000DD409D1|nr:hypothetical protein [Pseudogemmobacter bohemicus]